MAKSTDGPRIPKRVYEARVPLLRADLVQMQVALQQAPFKVLLVTAGDEASGKGDVVNILNGWLDPRGGETTAFHELTDEERERPPMWRYWRSLPPRGRIAIFSGGWHAEALAQDPRSRRKLAEFDHTLGRLAHFEGLLAHDGALIVKIWLRLSADAQRARLHELAEDPDTAWRVSPDDWRSHRDYDRPRAPRPADAACHPPARRPVAPRRGGRPTRAQSRRRRHPAGAFSHPSATPRPERAAFATAAGGVPAARGPAPVAGAAAEPASFGDGLRRQARQMARSAQSRRAGRRRAGPINRVGVRGLGCGGQGRGDSPPDERHRCPRLPRDSGRAADRR